MANCGGARVAGSANVATSTRSLGSGVAYVTRQYFVIVRPRTKIAVPPTRSKLACSIADHEQYAQHCPGSLPHHRTNSPTWGRPYGWQYSLPLITMPSADQFPVRGTIRRCDGPSGLSRSPERPVCIKRYSSLQTIYDASQRRLAIRIAASTERRRLAEQLIAESDLQHRYLGI
jgi:hypothetical protein